jgi:hypothetical protein
MADTIRKQILDSLITHLESQDFVTQGAIPVNPGKTRYKPEELPALSVFARAEESDINRYNKQQNALTVEVNYAGIIDRGPDDDKMSPLDQIEEIRGKIHNALVTATLDDLADPPVYIGGDIEYPAAEDMAFVTSVSCRIDYEHEHNDPYTQ